jgi:hypothetical protein
MPKLPKNIEVSLFPRKTAILENGVIMDLTDDVLKTICVGAHTLIPCKCARNENHIDWKAWAYSLTNAKDPRGCKACKYERRGIIRSTPKSYEDSLAAALDDVELKAGRIFVRLVDENDKRAPEQICKQANVRAMWKCTECDETGEADINNVVGKSKGCSSCSGPGIVAKLVVAFLKSVFGEKNVETECWIGDYKIDARIRFPDGTSVDVEIDGAQHYLRVGWSKEGRKLEEQIARDVEKMRLASLELVPTVRIPTVAVPPNARGVDPDVDEPWKTSLLATIEAARFVAIEAKRCGISNVDDVMHVVDGHENKYGAHDALLRTVFAGGNRVIYGDMDLIDARVANH